MNDLIEQFLSDDRTVVLTGDMLNAVRDEIQRLRAQLVKARAYAFEEIAKKMDHEADLETNSLHCGDNSLTISSAHRCAVMLKAMAKDIRELAAKTDEKEN